MPRVRYNRLPSERQNSVSAGLGAPEGVTGGVGARSEPSPSRGGGGGWQRRASEGGEDEAKAAAPLLDRRNSDFTQTKSNRYDRPEYVERPRPVQAVYIREGKRHAASEISSSLPVQMLIYFNIFVSLAYLVIEGGLVIDKLVNFYFASELQRLLLLIVYIVWAFGEGFRFYFGWAGNILEMVPQMSSFLLMTIFPQMICVIFLTVMQEHIWPADVVLGSIMLCFQVVELVYAFSALKAITSKRTSQFLRVAQQETGDHAHDN